MSNQSFPMSEEVERVQQRVDGFNYHKSVPWKSLVTLYGPRIRQDELVSIAEVIAHKSGIRLDRDARRRKSVMVKWFEENWQVIEPLLSSIVLEGK
jgi:hypothetical protein